MNGSGEEAAARDDDDDDDDDDHNDFYEIFPLKNVKKGSKFFRKKKKNGTSWIIRMQQNHLYWRK